jgi:hypothetical protein
MTEERKTFLARWSQRKLEVRQPQTSVPGSVEGVEPVAQRPADAEPALTAEEIEALPKVEELTPESDISVFLRRGVPDMLRNAALRRMWSLDPAIRNYVGDARDYAYDWNVPGGVPGNGPLLPVDNVETMVQQIFGREPEPKRVEPASDGPVVESQPGEPETQQVSGLLAKPDGADVAMQRPEGPSPVSEPAGSPVLQGGDALRAGAEHSGFPVAPRLQEPGDLLATSQVRRHGRAKPV